MSNVETLAGIIILGLKITAWFVIAWIVFSVGMSIYYHFHEIGEEKKRKAEFNADCAKRGMFHEMEK